MNDERIDVTERERALCEKSMILAGYVSPVGSVHLCSSCGRRIPWAELRWEERDYGHGPVVVSGVHDCPRLKKTEPTHTTTS